MLKRKKTKKRVKCPACDEMFSDQEDMFNHLQANCLHKISHTQDLITQEVQCDICERKFADYEEFLNHWRFGTNCKNKAWQLYRFRPKAPREKGFICPPIWESMIKRRIRTKKDYWALRKNINATAMLIKNIKYGFDNESWNVILVSGPTGIGKSRLGLLFCQYMAEYIEDYFGIKPNVHFARDHNDVRDKFDEAEMHDIIHCDEYVITSGADSRTNLEGFLNLIDTMRYARINLVVCTPFPPEELRSVQVICEMVYKNPKELLSKFVVYDPERVPLGWGKAKILSDKHPLEKRYKPFKKKMVEDLKKWRGLVSGATKEEQLMRDVNLVMGALTREYGDLKKASIAKRQCIDMAVLYVVGSQRHQESVGNRTYDTIKMLKEADKKPDDDTPTIKEARFTADEWLPPLEQEPTARNDQLYELIYKYSKPLNIAERRGREFWYYYVAQGMGQEKAAVAACESLGEDGINPDTGEFFTRPAFTQEKGYYSTFLWAPNCFGQGVEKAIKELYFPDGTHHGGQSEPDIVLPDDEGIVEAKGRMVEDRYKRLSKNLRSAVADEKYLREAVKEETPITIVGVDVGRKKFGCWVTIGRIIYD